MATSISWPVIGGASFSIPAAGEVGWPNLSNFLIALQYAQGTDAQITGTRSATTTPVSVAANDCVIRVKLSVPGAATVNLPAGYPGQYYIIVDETGDAATNNVTIVPNGAETINGAASLVLDMDYGAFAISFRGTNWVVTGSYAPSGGSGSIPRSDIAAGTPDYVVINDNLGLLSEEQYLSQTRGGFGANVGSYTGYVKAVAGVFSASAIAAADLPTGIDATKIGAGSVDNTEFGYLDGVTSSIQTQLNGKQASGNYITALTGDVVATGPGSAAAAIQAGVITNAMVNASAAIAYSKLNLTGSIVNADISASAAIAYSKLNLTGSIVNADISASAAIAYSKLNLTGSIVNADISASAAIALSKLAAQAANTVVANATGSSAVPTAVSLTDAATASTAMFRDANANTRINNSIDGYTTTATAAGTTTLTVASTKLQFFTGTTTQTVVMPVTSTLVLGQEFWITNRSTGTVTVNSSGSNLIATLSANQAVLLTCILTSGTTAASWDAFTPGTGTGTGSGLKNYIPTAAQNSATGWTASGGGIAVSTESTSSNFPDNITQTSAVKILRASGSDYVYVRWTQDAADYSKLSGILFDLKYAGTAGDYTLALYTNTASNYGGSYVQVTLPTSNIPSTGSGSSSFQTNGVAGASGTQYMELRINGIAGTTALYLNNVTFTPNPPAQAAAISEWQSLTPSTTQGFGTITSSSLQYRRVGSSIEVQGRFTPTSAASQARLGLPTGLTVTNGGLDTPVGRWWINNSTGSSRKAGPLWGTAGETYVHFGNDDYTTATPPTGNNNGDVISPSSQIVFVQFAVPVAEWAGNGTVNLGPGAQEQFLYNSGTLTSAGGSDTTNFAYGPVGVAIQAINSATASSVTTFRVRSQYPIQVNTKFSVEVSQSQSGPWIDSEEAGLGWSYQARARFGVRAVRVSGSTTDIDVQFGNSGASPSSGSAQVYETQNIDPWSNYTTWFWRVIVFNPSSPVGFGLAGIDGSAGLYKAGVAPGLTTGATISAGYLGERLTASLSNVTFTVSGTTYNAGSLVLTAGVWLVYGKMSLGSAGTTQTTTGASLSTTSATEDGTTLVRDLSTVLASRFMAPAPLYVNTTGTTVYLTGASNFTGTAPVTSAANSLLYAVRIA